MEDSFKVRVDKVFGSLSDSQPLNSLWSLTDEEIERKEWIRDKGLPDQEDLSGPFASRPVSIPRRKEIIEEDEEDDVNGLDRDSARLAAKPDDHDDEEWLIRSSVGMDCTLDKEEEEDEYDKIAVGIEMTHDRVSMHQINDYITHSDTFLPPSTGRATLSLKEDAQETCDASDGSQMVVTSTKSSKNLPSSVKSILKKDDYKAEHKSLKRVRFDPETAGDLDEQVADRSVKFASESRVEGHVSFPTPATDPRVPDYLRNPSKYTQYTLDSTNELDEEANKKAYLDFFNLIRKNRANESQPAEDMSDSPKSIMFTPRKKTGDDSMERTRGDHKENIPSKVVSSVIAAADEACAMEEDETEMTPVSSSTIMQKPQRKYRAKPTLEQLHD